MNICWTEKNPGGIKLKTKKIIIYIILCLIKNQKKEKKQNPWLLAVREVEKKQKKHLFN